MNANKQLTPSKISWHAVDMNLKREPDGAPKPFLESHQTAQIWPGSALGLVGKSMEGILGVPPDLKELRKTNRTVEVLGMRDRTAHKFHEFSQIFRNVSCTCTIIHTRCVVSPAKIVSQISVGESLWPQGLSHKNP